MVATTTFAPGTSTGVRSLAQREKHPLRARKSSGESTVKGGSGDREAPSNDGGVRHTPPVPYYPSSGPKDELRNVVIVALLAHGPPAGSTYSAREFGLRRVALPVETLLDSLD